MQVLGVLANPIDEITLDPLQLVSVGIETGVCGKIEVVDSRFGQGPREFIYNGTNKLAEFLSHINLARKSLYPRMLDGVVLLS